MSLGTGTRWVGISMTVSLLIAAAPVLGADIENVEALIRQGVELRQQRHDVRALPLFQKAYGMSRTPRTAGQLGLCEMALGYWLEAENHLGEALSLPEHPWVARNLGDLTGALASVRTNISDVTITGGPVGAEVSINGQSVGRLPLPSPVRLAKGPADISLHAPGYAPASQLLKVPGGTQETVAIVLAKATAEVPAQTGPIEATSPPASPSNRGATDQEPASGANPGRVAAWVTGAAAGLGLIFGAAETVVWVGKKNDFDNHQNPSTMVHDCATSLTSAGGPGCQGIHDDLVRARTLAFVGYGVAAALGVTSAILFATSGSGRSRSDMAFACVPDPSTRGVGCSLSF